MYDKVLVPLDRSAESEGVLDLLPELVNAGGQAVLLAIIPPGRTRSLGELVILGSQQEEEDRLRALSYLQRISRRLHESAGVASSTAVLVHNSVAAGIVAYAEQSEVDLISMYTHDRQGLARLVKGSVAREVERRASMPVRVFRPDELVAAPAPAPAADAGTAEAYAGMDLFTRLSPDQIARVVALGVEHDITAGRTLGQTGSANSVFLILSGECHLTAQTDIGQIAVRVAGPGESFPLAALVGEGASITSGEALNEMRVLEVPREALLELCAQDSEIGRGLYMATAQLFADRYSRTLAQLGLSAARELRGEDE